ncbi:hypothetical protein Tco_0983519 [Tanacetum coccineum]
MRYIWKELENPKRQLLQRRTGTTLGLVSGLSGKGVYEVRSVPLCISIFSRINHSLNRSRLVPQSSKNAALYYCKFPVPNISFKSKDKKGSPKRPPQELPSTHYVSDFDPIPSEKPSDPPLSPNPTPEFSGPAKPDPEIQPPTGPDMPVPPNMPPSGPEVVPPTVYLNGCLPPHQKIHYLILDVSI